MYRYLFKADAVPGAVPGIIIAESGCIGRGENNGIGFGAGRYNGTFIYLDLIKPIE